MQIRIKVQMPVGTISTSSIVECGIPSLGQRLTFCAYSDEMKARVLEMIVAGKDVLVGSYVGPKRDGEWFEAEMTKTLA
jgi:hypothetical protein